MVLSSEKKLENNMYNLVQLFKKCLNAQKSLEGYIPKSQFSQMVGG